ncbi:hypothetical protein A2954_00745 [Candidatus Roizmanbacteria bacterium RIFCSPLOWO2_01_FULL_37_12]|uniref:Uncharacterized protein n=1 Tax=Candidatus Roizmanbacteria bacterium RIFCSPLOWO2_01_FULL_37_12 TaxID=1802056 RepID=A0A1F7IDU1_9BACT|nr:MAG: hypothetical protein A2954_00745 [Candidatus Roizmanbacteria bacterium RIFCSPLOWO2_01_FULL_37_12]
MKISFPINYSGYLPLLRGILFLVKTDVLSLSELGIYICFITQVSFDQRHPHYRAILRDDKQIAKEFGVNKTTIYRARKSFIRAGLFIEKAGKTIVPNYYMFEIKHVKRIAKLPAIELQELFANPQEGIAFIEELSANLQQSQPHKPDQSFDFPSKVEASFTEEDKEWIKNNVKEE